MSQYVLHYAPDNASLIIRLALEELGVPYDTCLVDRRIQGQKAAAYLDLNPAGRIPTLETPHGPISETAAILLWLGDRHGRLVPKVDAESRGAFLNWLLFVSNTLHADLLQLFYTQRYGSQTALPEIRARAQARISDHLTLLDTQATRRLPDWICGATPSALDLYVAATLRWLHLYPADLPRWIDLKNWPQLAEMCARLEQRPCVATLNTTEGLGPAPFTNPHPARPPEGAAL